MSVDQNMCTTVALFRDAVVLKAYLTPGSAGYQYYSVACQGGRGVAHRACVPAGSY